MNELLPAATHSTEDVSLQVLQGIVDFWGLPSIAEFLDLVHNAPKNGNEEYSQEQVAMALARACGKVTVAAALLRCTPQTVHKYIRKYQMCKEALDFANEAMLDLAELQLHAATMSREPWAITFYLKNKGKDRGYGESTQRDVLGNKDISELTTEQLRELADGKKPRA